MNRMLLLGVLATTAATASAGQVTVYENHFSDAQSVGAEWVTNPDWNSAQNFGGFIGRFGQETQILELNAWHGGNGGGSGGQDGGAGDDGHNGGRSFIDYTLTFDLYLLDSWDGAYEGEFGPDYFGVSVNGESLLWEGWHGTKPEKNIVQPDVGPTNLGFNPRYADSIFRNLTLTFSLASNIDTFRVDFIGAPSSSNLDDESWGIDNVHVGAEVVPAPATLALAGFGLSGVRRRRKA